MTPLWGLVAAGSISRSIISRIPKLARQLGPVTSSSYRLAARISNILRAGTAVREFAELHSAGSILFCCPGCSPASLVDLGAFDWSSKIVLFCDTPEDPHLESELRKRGAAVAAMNGISDLPDRYLIVGDRPAVRFAKILVRSLRGHAVEISRDRLLLFQSALTLSGSLYTPLLETTVECLRQSGMEAPEADDLAEQLFQHSLRTFKHAGRKSWIGPVAQADEKAIAAQALAMEAKIPLMAAYFRKAAEYSFNLYQTFPELTRYDKSRWAEFRKRYKPS